MNGAAKILMSALVVTAVALAVASPARAQGVSSALTPAYIHVDPGASFDVAFDVADAGPKFNGFKVTVTYDPNVLTFVPLAPLESQQGCLMTGDCSTACGNTFHLFNAGADSLAVSDVLLCNAVSLYGPGTLYTLHFTAANTAQATWVRIRRAQFYDAGLFVPQGPTADAMIVVGSPAAVGTAANPAALRVQAQPNPAWSRVALTVAAAHDGEQVLDVLDLAGRLVRHVDAGWRLAGERIVRWDGTDASGRAVPAGVYLVRLSAGGAQTQTRVALLR